MTELDNKLSENNPLKTIYQNIIYKSAYSRWNASKNKREIWKESTDRYKNFFISKIPKSKRKEFKKACDSIYNLEVMPSMRALWTAGKALDREEICGYNCSYIVIDSVKSFSEMMYILMCGTGVGFSVEDRYISKLPSIPDELKESKDIITFNDSKLGWAKGYYKYISKLYKGDIPNYDLSKIRKAGERLKIFGGRASGPEPLEDLLNYTKGVFKENTGKKLLSIDCHDICCYIANVIVSGGTRRSACISLSDLDDYEMRHAKDGEFWKQNMHRSLANNSAVYNTKPTVTMFLKEWISLIRSKSGERGIFNRESAKFIVTQIGRRDPNYTFGGNPCMEVILRPYSFCNLSEVVIRENDSKDTLCKKVRQATILGCVQATLTNFNFLRREWKSNCEDERLLGVSLTGLRDHEILKHVSSKSKVLLTEMKQVALATAEEWSKLLDINMPTAITTVKPSGTVSQLVNSSSGLHPRYSPFYLRRIRLGRVDKLSDFLINSNIPYYPEVGQDKASARTLVFEFPIKSPKSSVMVGEVNAIEQLEYWLMLQKYWCEHKPSVTIYVKDDEWLKVGNWVYENWNYVSGISFLPVEKNVYELAPYEEIDEETYEELIENFPKNIDLSLLDKIENIDTTSGSKEYACSAGGCEI